MVTLHHRDSRQVLSTIMLGRNIFPPRIFPSWRAVKSGRKTKEIRVSGNAPAVATAIRAAIKDASPLIEMPEIHAIDELVSQTITTERLITTLSSCFGGLALLLACIGLYGVMSYNVAGRTSEIGIRMALGAQPRTVFKLIARQGMTLVLIGIVIGLAAAFALTRLITSLLFGVSPTDSLTF